MADQSVRFISKTELNAKKEEKRKAREHILQQAKEDYDRKQQRREKRKATGEDTWMLASVNNRIENEDEHRTKKKKKKEKKHKEKKSKKHKKKTKEERDSSSESDEWVEKTATNEDENNSESQQTTQQRDGWMLFPCFGESSKSKVLQKTNHEEVEDKKQCVSVIDMAGQHSRELNPYWKNGGTGLPSEKPVTSIPESSTVLYDAKWLRKALQRSREQAEEEGRTLEEVVADRWGSLEKLENMIKEAEKRDERKEYPERDYDRKHGNSRRREDERCRRDYRDARYSDKKYSYKPFDSRKHDARGYEKDSEYNKQRDKDYEEYQKERQRKGTTGIRSANPFKKPDSNTEKSSLKFIKPTDGPSTIPSAKPGVPSGGWKKKTEKQQPKVNRIDEARKKRLANTSGDSSSDSSDSEAEQERITEKEEQEEAGKEHVEKKSIESNIPVKKITEADLNNMGAKILKAELMGNEDLASELKATLEKMREDKLAQESSTSSSINQIREEEVVVLTRTDKFGNTRPVAMNEVQEPKLGRRKREKVPTHSEGGERERYFADDDRYDLNEIVRREKMNTSEDYNAMFSRLASKGANKTDSDDFTLDDHFVSGASKKYSKAQEEERNKMKAIKEHQRLSAQLSKCRFCFENPELAKHLIIAIGLQVYLALPLHTSLTEGHCLIIPMQHQLAYTYLDEDVIDEIKVFKKGLTRMFQEMEKDVIFLETCRNLTRQNHMIIECIPVPKEEGDLAPMYFKKAILESDSEWSQNKKLVDTSKKGLAGSIPKGLPYFSVEFGLDGGFAHIVEDEHLFPQYFGKEIIGGMLDLEPWTWHKPHRQNFEQHKNKVLQFADWWKPFDWTKRLSKKR